MALHEGKLSTRSRRGGGVTNLPTGRSKVRSESAAQTHLEQDSKYRKGGGSAEFQPAFTRADEVREKTKIGTYTGSGVQLSEVYSNKGLVKPTWFRVSQTPFHGAAVATGGYGRRIDDTSVSLDAPDFFHIDEVINHNPKITYGDTHRNVQQRPKHSNAESHDAPDWWRCDEGTIVARTRHSALCVGKQLIMEPLLPEVSRGKIDWGSAR